MAGNRREKHISSLQQLLDFKDDPELQASLAAAQREAEQVLETITYTRLKKKQEPTSREVGFPAHLRREEIQVAIPADKQELLDQGQLVLIGYEPREVLCHRPSEVYVTRYLEPVFGVPSKTPPDASDTASTVPVATVPVDRVEMPAALGDQGKYDASVPAAIVHGKFGLHIPYYRLQDIFSASGWTPTRSTIDYLTDLAAEAVEELPKLMKQRLLAGQYIGLDDTTVTLIMPQKLPELSELAQADSRLVRLVEKMQEARRKGEKSLAAKMWAYSGGADAPYDMFDFRVSLTAMDRPNFLAIMAGM